MQHATKINCIGITMMTFLIVILGVNSNLKAQDHLLLSEIVLQTSDAEFIEIFNPTQSAIALDNYYLADNQQYPYLPVGLPSLTPGDFVVQFPAGTSIAPGGVIVIATDGAGFESEYAQLADFEIKSTSGTTTDMIEIETFNSSITNGGEGVVLFHWNGTDNVVQDVDLMNAGVPTALSEIVDKTGIAGYLQDAHTMPYQDQTPPAGYGFSTKRIQLEGANEISSRGNGITGNDETSEDISITWDQVYTAPTPGNVPLSALAVDEISEMESLIRIYPNPANAVTTLFLNADLTDISVSLINAIGSEVMVLECAHLSESEPFQMDISRLQSGIYFVQIKANELGLVKKLMVR